VLASGARDGRVRFHDGTGRLLESEEPLRVRVLSLAPLGDLRFAGGTADGAVLVVSPEPAVAVRELARIGGPVHALLAVGGTLFLGGLGEVVRVEVAGPVGTDAPADQR
jgi:hypothetical protein